MIDGGTAGGQTLLKINNVGGPGAQTTGDGILVVEAVNGGSILPGAFVNSATSFRLANIVAAGPYEYLLVRGGARTWNRKRYLSARRRAATGAACTADAACTAAASRAAASAITTTRADAVAGAASRCHALPA